MATEHAIAAGLYPWLRPVYSNLVAQFDQAKLHHALLIHGVEGLGKSQLAIRLAERLQCDLPQSNKACGHCKSCHLHQSGTHPDCYLITPLSDKASISIDQIRKVQASIVNTGLTNDVRVVVIPQAHLMTTSAANALLKVLEEPPKGVHFILTCSQRSLLPATVVSRCLDVNVGGTSSDKLAAWVNKQVANQFSVAQFGLFNYSPLLALRGIESGFIDFVSQLRQAMIDIIICQDHTKVPIYPLLMLLKDQGKGKTTDINQALNLIHLLIIDCSKIASGLSCNNSFELTTSQTAAIAKIDVKRFLALEDDLNQLNQLVIEQPSINKLLQLQQVIVNFVARSGRSLQ